MIDRLASVISSLPVFRQDRRADGFLGWTAIVHAPIKDGFYEWLESRAEPVPETRCWIWTGHRNRDGYGVISIRPHKFLAHRIAWERAYGPISAELERDHLCAIKACVNPMHLEAVSHVVNTRRRSARVRGALFWELRAGEIHSPVSLTQGLP